MRGVEDEEEEERNDKGKLRKDEEHVRITESEE